MYKIGNCKETDCIYSGKLIAGRCQTHYWQYRSSQSKNKPQQILKKEKKAGLSVYFASQVITAPDNCEECGKSIIYYKQAKSRVIVAHILPKRDAGGFPSVATHPQNRLFLCPDCHTAMDTKGTDYVIKMKSYPLMIERLKKFISEIKEKRQLPNNFSNFV